MTTFRIKEPPMNTHERLFLAEEHRHDLLADAAATRSARRAPRARARGASSGRFPARRARSRRD
jgi:hypothetical protein